jgi:zinc transporter
LALRASDRIEPLIERLGGKLDSIEESMLAVTGDGELRGRLAHIRRTIIGMRRLVWPQRDMLNTLEIEELSFFTARDRVRLREAAARAGRLGEELAALSERSVLVHEQMLDMRAESLNRTMLVLTAVTVVFMPLTVISGVLGMNVAGIPFSQSPYAFIGVCVGLVVLALAMVLWMRHRKWL